MQKVILLFAVSVLYLLFSIGCGKGDDNANHDHGHTPKTGDTPPVPPVQPPTKPVGNARYIPADAMHVASLNLDSLIAKLDATNLFNHLPFNTTTEDSYAKQWIDFVLNPASWGITKEVPVHVFLKLVKGEGDASLQPLLGIVAAVEDAQKLSEALKELAQAAANPPIWKEGDGFNFFADPNGWGIGFNENVWITYGSLNEAPADASSTAEANLKTIFAAKDSLIGNPSFARYLAKPKDLGLWIDEKKFSQILDILFLDEVSEVKKLFFKSLDLKASYGIAVRFETGAVEVDLIYSYDAAPFGGSDMKGPGLNKNPDLLNTVSQNAILAFGSSSDMTPVRKWLKKVVEPFVIRIGGLREIDNDVQAHTGLTLTGLLDLLKGDGILALNGMESEPHPVMEFPLPKIILGMNLHSSDNANTLIAHLKEKETLATLNELGFDLFRQEDNLFFSTTSLKEQPTASPIKGVRRKLVASNDLGGWIDFPALTHLLLQLDAPREATDPLSQLGFLTLSGDFGKGVQTYKIKLKLKSDKRNSLRLLFDEIMKWAVTPEPGSANTPDNN